jgi:hypothetical protein
MRLCPSQCNEGQPDQQEDLYMADRPSWLSFGTPNGISTAGTTPDSPPLLVEFHQPLHFAIFDDEKNASDGLSVVILPNEQDKNDKNEESTARNDVRQEELAYIEKARHLVAEKYASGQFERPADYQPPPVGTMSSGRMCDLCELAHYTPWYAEFHLPLKFTILDCDACDVPIAVFSEHRVELSPEEVSFMEEALNMVGEQKYTGKFPKWMFDHNMRQIPDHYHFHVRPLLW